MDIGKTKTVRTNVPGARPVVISKSKPIHVPNWPTKRPVSVPVPSKPVKVPARTGGG